MLDIIGPYNIKETRIKIQAHTPTTNTIQYNTILKILNKGCIDMYILISKKKEIIKAVYKSHEEDYRFKDSDWGKSFLATVNNYKGIHITCYNFKYYSK